MATNSNEKTHEIKNFSGAVQRKTSDLFRKDNELKYASGADFEERLGAFKKSRGMSLLGETVTTSTSTSTSSSTSTSTSTSSTTTA